MEEVEESYMKGSGKKKMPGMNRFLAKLLIRMNGFTKDLYVISFHWNSNHTVQYRHFLGISFVHYLFCFDRILAIS